MVLRFLKQRITEASSSNHSPSSIVIRSDLLGKSLIQGLRISRCLKFPCGVFPLHVRVGLSGVDPSSPPGWPTSLPRHTLHVSNGEEGARPLLISQSCSLSLCFYNTTKRHLPLNAPNQVKEW